MQCADSFKGLHTLQTILPLQMEGSTDILGLFVEKDVFLNLEFRAESGSRYKTSIYTFKESMVTYGEPD